jgi:hypothetical protein
MSDLRVIIRETPPETCGACEYKERVVGSDGGYYGWSCRFTKHNIPDISSEKLDSCPLVPLGGYDWGVIDSNNLPKGED